jgi:hypothetical protein
MNEFGPETPYEAIKEAGRIVEHGAEFEYWSIRASSVADYEKLFQDILNGDSIEEIVSERQEKYGEIAVLDLMSYGYFLEDLQNMFYFHHGLAVSLSNPYTPQNKYDIGISKDIFGHQGLDLLTGNVLRRKTWQKIKEWLEKIDRPGFDFIFCAPGGISCLFPHQNKYYAFVLEQMWRTLNPDGGVIFTEIHFNGEEQDMDTVINKLGQIHGITMLKGKDNLRLTRNKDAPEKLFPEIK